MSNYENEWYFLLKKKKKKKFPSTFTCFHIFNLKKGKKKKKSHVIYYKVIL